MKVTVQMRGGSSTVFDWVGPIRVIEHPQGTMDILHDEGTGWDYWFWKDGTCDGTGMSTCNLTTEQAIAIMEGLKGIDQPDGKN